MTGLLTRAQAGSGGSERRRPRLVIPIVAAVLLIVLLVWVVAFSPVFSARSVAVKGNLQRLTVSEIRAAAKVPRGTPLTRLDTGAVRDRVQALADVASASVTVSYPSTVSITVVERIAVGYLSLDSGFALVDKTGNQFLTSTTAPGQLPHFELAPGADPVPSTMAAASVAAALPKDILGELSSVSAGSPTAVELVLRDGRIVRWGSPDRNGEKAQLLIPLLKQPGDTFDISNPDLVVVS